MNLYSNPQSQLEESHWDPTVPMPISLLIPQSIPNDNTQRDELIVLSQYQWSSNIRTRLPYNKSHS